MIILLIVIYFIFGVIQFILKGLGLPESKKNKLNSIIGGIKAIFIPLAIIIILVSFTLWKIKILGIPVLVTLVYFFKPAKNFLQGLLIRSKSDLTLGTEVKIGDFHGRVIDWGFTEMKLSTGDSTISVPYTHLYANGYAILSHRKASQAVQLTLEQNEEVTTQDLEDLLVASPFIKLNARINLEEVNSKTQITFVPRSETYLEDIKSLINSAGYSILSPNS